MTISSILFICLGNICRSPLAEGVFRHEAVKRGAGELITIDSAGTGNWHVGEPPDQRAIEIANHHGIDISHQRCRALKPDDFRDFDLIIAMDQANIQNARAIGGYHGEKSGSAQLVLFTKFARLNSEPEIPDPYYRNPEDFEIAYQMIKEASIGTLRRLGH